MQESQVSPQEQVPAATQKKNETRSFIVFCAIVAAVAILLRLFIFDTLLVDGPSMQPTLHTGERVLVQKVSNYFGLPKRNQVIVCHFEGRSEYFIKRVIGLPGETISIQNGEVYIDGEKLSADTHANGVRPRDMAPVTIPEDSVFVMGDNRGNSSDSCEYGPVSHDLIMGQAVFVIWPLSEFGTLR